MDLLCLQCMYHLSMCRSVNEKDDVSFLLQGKLSSLQLEGILYAVKCVKDLRLPNNVSPMILLVPTPFNHLAGWQQRRLLHWRWCWGWKGTAGTMCVCTCDSVCMSVCAHLRVCVCVCTCTYDRMWTYHLGTERCTFTCLASNFFILAAGIIPHI